MKIIRRVLMLVCFCGGLLFNTSIAQAQQCSQSYASPTTSGGNYYFDGDGGNGWGTRNIGVYNTNLTGGTGSGGRIIISANWGWNNGNQWTSRGDFTETIRIRVKVNGTTVAELVTPSDSQNNATLSSQGGASMLSGGGNVGVTSFGQYPHSSQILLPSWMTSITSIQIEGT